MSDEVILIPRIPDRVSSPPLDGGMEFIDGEDRARCRLVAVVLDGTVHRSMPESWVARSPSAEMDSP